MSVRCNDCSEIFDGQGSFFKHFLWKHTSSIRIYGKNDKIDCSTFEANNYPLCACKICGKISDFYEAANHILGHIGAMPYFCSFCHFSTISKLHLQQHVLVHDSTLNNVSKPIIHEADHECERCDRIFPRWTLLAHHYVVHLESMPFMCHLCSMKFSEKKDFIIHNHLHKMTPVCDICKCHFPTRVQCLLHVLTHSKSKFFRKFDDFIKCYTCQTIPQISRLSSDFTDDKKVPTIHNSSTRTCISRDSNESKSVKSPSMDDILYLQENMSSFCEVIMDEGNIELECDKNVVKIETPKCKQSPKILLEKEYSIYGIVKPNNCLKFPFRSEIPEGSKLKRKSPLIDFPVPFTSNVAKHNGSTLAGNRIKTEFNLNDTLNYNSRVTYSAQSKLFADTETRIDTPHQVKEPSVTLLKLPNYVYDMQSYKNYCQLKEGIYCKEHKKLREECNEKGSFLNFSVDNHNVHDEFKFSDLPNSFQEIANDPVESDQALKNSSSPIGCENNKSLLPLDDEDDFNHLSPDFVKLENLNSSETVKCYCKADVLAKDCTTGSTDYGLHSSIKCSKTSEICLSQKSKNISCEQNKHVSCNKIHRLRVKHVYDKPRKSNRNERFRSYRHISSKDTCSSISSSKMGKCQRQYVTNTRSKTYSSCTKLQRNANLHTFQESDSSNNVNIGEIINLVKNIKECSIILDKLPTYVCDISSYKEYEKRIGMKYINSKSLSTQSCTTSTRDNIKQIDGGNQTRIGLSDIGVEKYVTNILKSNFSDREVENSPPDEGTLRFKCTPPDIETEIVVSSEPNNKAKKSEKTKCNKCKNKKGKLDLHISTQLKKKTSKKEKVNRLKNKGLLMFPFNFKRLLKKKKKGSASIQLRIKLLRKNSEILKLTRRLLDFTKCKVPIIELHRLPEILYDNYLKGKPLMLSNISPMIFKVHSVSKKLQTHNAHGDHNYCRKFSKEMDLHYHDHTYSTVKKPCRGAKTRYFPYYL